MPQPSPRTARFTYAGSVTIASRSDRADVTTTGGDGTLRIYLSTTPPAHPGTIPSSFAAGEPVAEYAIHLLDTLQRQAPGVGVLVGDGQLTQQTAAELSLDGERYRFGEVGSRSVCATSAPRSAAKRRRAPSPSVSPARPA